MMDWIMDKVWRVVTFTLLAAILVIGVGLGAFATGTALWRSENTDPRVGTVWTGGTFSNVSEKCYGVNLIIRDGDGLATIKNAPECKEGN